jgi:hypothetical protein
VQVVTTPLPAPPAPGLSPRDVFEIVMAHLAMALTVGALTAAAALYALMSALPIYEARGLLSYQIGPEYVYVPDTTGSGIKSPDPGTLEPFVNAEMQILDSTVVRNLLLDRLIAGGTYEITPLVDRDRLLSRLEKAVNINLITGSFIVDLRVRDTKPERGAAITRMMIEVYLDQRVKSVGIEAPDFLAGQIVAAEARIAAVDKAVFDLVQSRDLAAYDQHLDAVKAQQARTAQDPLAARAVVAELTGRVHALEAALAALPAEQKIAGNPAFDKTELALALARVDLAAALARMKALIVIEAEQTVFLADQGAKATELAELRARRDADVAQVAALRSRLLDSNLTIARNRAGSGTVRVLESGVVDPIPVGLPDRIKLIAGGLIGLAAALLAILAAEIRSARLHTGRIAAVRLGLPILGEVGERQSMPLWSRRKVSGE